MTYQKPPEPRSAGMGVVWSNPPIPRTVAPEFTGITPGYPSVIGAPDFAQTQMERAFEDQTGKILAERGKTYGDFVTQAQIAQTLKASMAASSNWSRMRPYQREALDMIAGKIARILNGDPMHQDSWADIAGYARLVADNLQ